jgi:long-chain acyl-CoA synthetase
MPNLSDTLRRAELLYGRSEAVVCGGSRLNYEELAKRCRQLAGGLRRLGVEPGDRVAVLMRNCHRYLEAYLAIPGMGAVIVPLNSRHSLIELRYALRDCGPKVLLVDEAHASTAAELDDCVGTILACPESYEALLARSDETPLGGPSDENDLAGVFYTGGTTGAAKGVMLSHRNLMTNGYHLLFLLQLQAEDVYLHAGPMFHLADAWSNYVVTWAGGKHVFVPAFEPASVLNTIAIERVTCSAWVTTMINLVINHQGVNEADLGSLRLLMHGGAPIAQDLLERAIRALGCSFMQLYGMTEASPVLTALRSEETLVGDVRLRSAGLEVPGVEVTVRRPDGTRCRPMEIGEVVARGANLMLGYWHRKEETNEALRGGWYWSGDAGYLDESGYLYIVDRLKDMIITGGENVYSIEVENAIHSHKAVLECAVIPVPDEVWGERVHALIALKPGSTLTIDDLRAHCRELIADYKSPRSVEFLEALPKSGAGKILKRELRQKYWANIGSNVH